MMIHSAGTRVDILRHTARIGEKFPARNTTPVQVQGARAFVTGSGCGGGPLFWH